MYEQTQRNMENTKIDTLETLAQIWSLSLS